MYILYFKQHDNENKNLLKFYIIFLHKCSDSRTHRNLTLIN